ncbi:MAG: porin [Candidatus Thiodiazotropha sp. (ex Ctena orbiculata)]|nr:porin [Candidatus Thiodiazotropha taylori]
MARKINRLIAAVGLAVAVQTSGGAIADDKPPMGWLIGELGDSGITVSGWAEASASYINNDGDSTLPQAFFNREEGLTLNQVGLFIEKKPKGNVVGRVGPFPGPMPQEVDFGFNLTAIYGSDTKFFRTEGWDDDWADNEDPTNENFITLAQAFLDIYVPVLGGSNLMVGLFHTPLENEIGFSLPPPAPAPFFTRAYSFMHGPAKHAGALFSTKLPTAEGAPLWGAEIGVVQGWNNWEDENGDADLIFNLRWRSPGLATWVDWENIYGNGADDGNPVTETGSPIPAVSALAGDDDLKRYLTYLTVSHALDPKNRIAVEFTYGSQEKALIPGIVDADWKGVNINWHHQLRSDISLNVRGEWFDTDGVHALLPQDGTVTAFTANLTWNMTHALRIRPEIRYDSFDGTGAPFNGDDSQLFAALDVIFSF